MRGAHLALGLLGVLGSFPVEARETALLVTYGAEAPRQEGDDDSLQVLFLEIPETVDGPLYVRLYDPDTGGKHDHAFGALDTVTRFAVYGGQGAAEAAGLQPDAETLSAGELLTEMEYAEDSGLDDVWHTLVRIDPAEGEAVADGRVFRLVVQGVQGNDANVYDVTVSRSAHRNSPPAGLRITNYEPTFRLAGTTPGAEARFRVPKDVAALSIKSFDAAGAPMTLETAARSIPLKPSAQGDYAETQVEFEESETGRLAAITLRRGGENPNDVVFSVSDPNGGALPLEWPVHVRRSRARLAAAVQSQPLANCRSVLFQVTADEGPEAEDWVYDWEFGDGSSGRGNHIVHRFQAPGEYRVRLAATTPSNPMGMVSDFTVTVNQVPVASANADRVVAPGEPVRFDATASRDEDGRISSFEWDFGDGSGARGPEVTHRFAEPGLYGVILRVEDDHDGPCNFANDRLFVRVNSAPVAEAGDTVHASVGETVVFDGGRSYDTDGQIVGYEWEFGDRGSAEGDQVEKVFDRPGEFVALLTVRDDAEVANSAASDRVTVLVNVPPLAAAGVDRALAVGESSVFDGGGSSDPDGRIINYQWDFGDGGKGRGETLPYAFAEPGRYTVTLSVRDDSPAASGIDSDQLLVVVNAPPVADAGDPQSVTSSEVRFDATRSRDPDGRIIAYDWDFGDGTQGVGPSPTHVFGEPGIYRATVTVTDDSGTPRNTHQDSVVVVVNERPLADAGPDRRAAPGETVRFTAQGSIDPDGAIVAYEWDFGDGTSATGLGASHAYERPGLYTVRLTVRDDSGHDVAVDFDEAFVRVNAQPVARAGRDVVVAPNQEIGFDAGESFDPDGEISTYRWTFSDGETAVEASTRRSFSKPGIYTASLYVEDGSGQANAGASDEMVVRVNHPPRAVPGKDSFSCSNVAQFDGSASVDADNDTLTYIWDLGDGNVALGATVSHVYAEGGTYPVTLTVDDGQGVGNSRHTDAMMVRVNRHPVAVPGDEITACAGEVVLFDGSGSSDPDGDLLRYLWDFGDDTGAEEVNPSKIYKKGGTYSASLRVVDDSGLACSSDVEEVSVQVAESPTADAGADMTVCANTAVTFDGSGSKDFDGVVNRYRWDFGDGERGGGATPEHIFTEAGRYRVRLTVTGDQMGSCDNTDTDEAWVTVLAAPAPVISGRRQVPLGQDVEFDAGGSSSADAKIVSWRWDFGDGASAEGARAAHTWTTPGRYPLRLTLTTDGDTDCSTVHTEQTVIVNQAPVAEAGTDQTVGVHQLVEFDAGASHDPDGAIVSYEWDFGDGETGQGVQARHRYKSSGRYRASLRVRDNMNLENSTVEDTVEVTVNAPPVAVIEVPEPACPGKPTAFSAAASNDADGEVTDFRWLFGDGNEGAGVQTSHVYDRPGRYHVTLIADDGLGVSNSLQQTTQLVQVNSPPSAIAGRNRLVCPTEPVLLDGSGSYDLDGELAAASWTVGEPEAPDRAHRYDGLTATHAFQEPGRYTVELVVNDDSGASCSAASDSAMIRVNSPPLADAGPDREAFLGGAHDAILFDASGSSDPDSDPLSFIWDLGDGNRKAGARVYHTYARPGRYVVTLLADDGTGTACGAVADEIIVEARIRTAK